MAGPVFFCRASFQVDRFTRSSVFELNGGVATPPRIDILAVSLFSVSRLLICSGPPTSQSRRVWTRAAAYPVAQVAPKSGKYLRWGSVSEVDCPSSLDASSATLRIFAVSLTWAAAVFHKSGIPAALIGSVPVHGRLEVL